MDKRYYKWIGKFLLGVIVTLGIQGLIMYIVDPYQYYRKASLYKPVYLSGSGRYINAGILKSFDYDAAIVGNSMTENFLVSDLNKTMNWNTVKLAMQGATSYEMSTVYEAVFREKKAKNVVTTFDFFAFDKGKKETTYEMPFYLYNKNPLDDFKYLFNLNMLKKETTNIYNYNYKIENARETDINFAYFWGDTATYSKDIVMKHFLDTFKVSKSEDIKTTSNAFDKSYADHVISNFNDHLYKYIKENPQVTFHIILPPYSIVYWKMLQYNNLLDEYAYSKEYIFSKLLEADNVILHDFQREEMIINNLDNYRDMTHYSHVINNYMAYNLNNEKYFITKDNYKKAIDKLNEMIEKYELPR
jgi:hypothetical protein